jgi:hypothetical protein
VEYHLPNHAVQWLADPGNQTSILRHALPRKAEEGGGIIRRPETVVTDYSAQLYDLAGFRLEPSERLGGLDGVSYIQAYTTEKSVWYQLQKKGVFARRYPSETLTEKGLADIISSMHAFRSAFIDARGEVRDGLDVAQSPPPQLSSEYALGVRDEGEEGEGLENEEEAYLLDKLTSAVSGSARLEVRVKASSVLNTLHRIEALREMLTDMVPIPLDQFW